MADVRQVNRRSLQATLSDGLTYDLTPTECVSIQLCQEFDPGNRQPTSPREWPTDEQQRQLDQHMAKRMRHKARKLRPGNALRARIEAKAAVMESDNGG